MAQPAPTTTNFAQDTAAYLQQFQNLSQQASQISTKQEQISASTQDLVSRLPATTIPTTTATLPLSEDMKEMAAKMNAIKVTEGAGKRSGIEDNTQGTMTVSRQGKQLKANQYHSDKFTDFASMSKILRPELLDGCDRLNFTHPSKIQAEAVPRCLSAPDYPNLIGQAHHGSGKTATFALIMLQRIDENCSSLQGLVVVHSRELAIQTHSVVRSLGQFIQGLKLCLALKGEPIARPWDRQIMIGTPGTIIDKHLNAQRRSPHGLKGFFRDFKILIIDEADEFLKANAKSALKQTRSRGRGGGSGFGNLFDQLKTITTDIQKNTGSGKLQTLLFSATYPASVKKLAIEIAPNPFIIKVAQKSVQLENIRIFRIMCEDEVDKFQTLLRVIALSNIGQMIIFVNTVTKAKQLIQGLESKELGIACSALFGRGMDISVRDQTMEQFRKNQTQCLVASNLIARGIDVPAVGLVVNFEVPINRGLSESGKEGLTFDSETFMHRVGRTGRFGTKGVCINLVAKDDQIGNDRLDAIQKEYSLQIQLLNNTAKAVKETIVSWLHDE